jgi:hypothetical protein
MRESEPREQQFEGMPGWSFWGPARALRALVLACREDLG